VINSPFGKGIMQSQKANRPVSRLAGADQLRAAGKIIEFEVAKKAFEKGGPREPKQFSCLGTTNRLPNLAADDWLDWTALGALFVAVALIPALGVILSR
jgi:hypothetical protein